MMGYIVEAKTICSLVLSCKHIYFCCEVGDFNMGGSKGLTLFLRCPKVVIFLDPQFIWFCFSTPQVVMLKK